MAKNNKKNNTKAGAINLDFTDVYALYNTMMNTPCEGTMQIPEPEKLSIWKRIKKFFKKK